MPFSGERPGQLHHRHRLDFERGRGTGVWPESSGREMMREPHQIDLQVPGPALSPNRRAWGDCRRAPGMPEGKSGKDTSRTLVGGMRSLLPVGQGFIAMMPYQGRRHRSSRFPTAAPRPSRHGSASRSIPIRKSASPKASLPFWFRNQAFATPAPKEKVR